MVQDDSYYINLGYEYARRRKELDLSHDEKQRLLALSVEVKREVERADKTIVEGKKLRSAFKEAYYREKHAHDHDHDRTVFTSEGNYVWSIYANPPEIQRVIDMTIRYLQKSLRRWIFRLG
jgi:hypothetical protein